VAWRFHATGAGYARFCAAVRPLLAGDAPPDVTLAGNLPDGAWESAMREADVALVTMKRGAERVLVPSKTYSALAAGQAILAVCPGESDLADLVIRHGCGWVIEPGNVEGLARAVRQIAGEPEGLLQRRRRARSAGLEHYGLSVIGRRWAELLRAVACTGPVAWGKRLTAPLPTGRS
jgi:glycosyltransferase involved in cell wall biosynthesis